MARKSEEQHKTDAVIYAVAAGKDNDTANEFADRLQQSGQLGDTDQYPAALLDTVNDQKNRR